MKIERLAIPDVLLITPDVFGDERGFFLESYHEDKFREAGISERFVQDNHSKSTQGVLRGLHFQTPPFAQGKLVRVSAGEVFDVAVDLRKASETYGQWVAYPLFASTFQMLYIPPGFAHGFQVLSETAEFQYKCTSLYEPSAEGGLMWNDPDLAIEWPLLVPKLSAKDTAYPPFSKYQSPF
jgi:dTDP-4-dehydrorhamnose 3,5-epimerase